MAANLNALASNGLAPLDPEAQRRKDEATLVADIPVVAIGGIGSTPDDDFFKTVRKVKPSASVLPLRGTGNGIQGTGIGNASAQIRDALMTNPPVSLFVGHSLGASLLHNEISRLDPEGTNTQRRVIYADPPALSRFQRPPKPFLFLSPTAQAIQRANDTGIGGNTNTLSFTGGNAANKEAHSPWSYPDAPGSQNSITNFINAMRMRLGQTNNPAPPIRQ